MISNSAEQTSAEEVIKVAALAKRYGSLEALSGVFFKVFQGEIFAYLGPNGSGKTTTIRILTGLTRATSGDAWINGFHYEKQALDAKRQCGVVPQTINLDQELTVFDNLEIHRRLFGLSSESRRRIDLLLDYVGLLERRNATVRQLSGGMKRRLMIARAMVHEPVILFLDEPTVGLDPAIRRDIWALIKKVQADGVTVFLTTHYIEEAEFLADRIALLDRGEIVALDKPQTMMSALGEWAIDQVVHNRVVSSYFATHAEAGKHALEMENSYSIRRVNLEDAFLQMTGKKLL